MHDVVDRARRRADVDRGADAAERVTIRRGGDGYALCSELDGEWLESTHYVDLEAWR